MLKMRIQGSWVDHDLLMVRLQVVTSYSVLVVKWLKDVNCSVPHMKWDAWSLSAREVFNITRTPTHLALTGNFIVSLSIYANVGILHSDWVAIRLMMAYTQRPWKNNKWIRTELLLFILYLDLELIKGSVGLKIHYLLLNFNLLHRLIELFGLEGTFKI